MGEERQRPSAEWNEERLLAAINALRQPHGNAAVDVAQQMAHEVFCDRLAAAREAERLREKVQELAAMGSERAADHVLDTEMLRERVAALEALLDEIEDLVAPEARYRFEMGVGEAVEVPDNVCAEVFEAMYRYRRALAAGKEPLDTPPDP